MRRLNQIYNINVQGLVNLNERTVKFCYHATLPGFFRFLNDLQSELMFRKAIVFNGFSTPGTFEQPD